MLTITIEKFAETAILHCQGRIVRGDETSILCSALRQKAGSVILDLTEVDAIDAAGIGALVSLQAAGVYLMLMNPTPRVREILTITKLDSVFEIVESQPAAETMESAPARNECSTIAV